MDNNVKQIAQEKGIDTPFNEFVELEDRTFFAGDDGGEAGLELWASDGTTEGTNLFRDISPGGYDYYGTYIRYESSPQNLTEINGKIYFSAGSDGDTGRELWVTDGTDEGTKLVKDIYPGTDSTQINTYQLNSSPDEFTELNGKVYFSAGTLEGRELWVTDGTSEGTQVVKDINPGGDSFEYYTVLIEKYGSNPENLTQFNDKIYFSARVGVREEFQFDLFDLEDRPGDTGRELWVTDGTTEGTQLVADINPGAEYSNPSDFSVVGDELLFTANDGTGEQEYRVNLDGSVELVNGVDPNEPNEINGTGNNDVLTGTEGADIIKGFDGRDTLQGGAGDDTLIGNNRQDKLVGGAGNDSLVGGSGDDTLDGGLGNDILTGNGNDSFVLRAGDGADIITDYVIGSDRLLLADGLTADDLTFSGSDIFAGDEKLATLNNVNASNLRPFNFTEI